MDAIQAALDAAGSRSAVAPAFAFIAGVATAFGPCTAPRVLAAVGLVTGERSRAKRALLLASLVVGLSVSYVAIGCAVSALNWLANGSTWIYLVCALAYGAIGVQAIAAARSSRCLLHPHPDRSGSVSLGAAFLLGCSMGLVVSPCCTPFVAAVAGFGAVSSGVVFGVLTIGSFALGHALPLILAGCGADRFRGAFVRHEVAVATVGGTLLVGLAGYYAVLA